MKQYKIGSSPAMNRFKADNAQIRYIHTEYNHGRLSWTIMPAALPKENKLRTRCGKDGKAVFYKNGKIVSKPKHK